MTADRAVVLEAHGLTKLFVAGADRVEALRGITLSVRAGEFVAVMGPSGSGKSTLLHLLGGLEPPTAGTVRLGGQDLTGMGDDARTLLRRRRLGFVFQAFNLLETLTAEENVGLPLAIDGVSEGEVARRARALLDRVGLQGRYDRLPGQLSGGEQQRVAIARGLVTEPIVLLADEPTGNLDSATGHQVLGLLRQLVDTHGQTLLLVTHDARHAALADRLLRLRDGAVVEEQALTRRRDVGLLME